MASRDPAAPAPLFCPLVNHGRTLLSPLTAPKLFESGQEEMSTPVFAQSILGGGSILEHSRKQVQETPERTEPALPLRGETPLE